MNPRVVTCLLGLLALVQSIDAKQSSLFMKNGLNTVPFDDDVDINAGETITLYACCGDGEGTCYTPPDFAQLIIPNGFFCTTSYIQTGQGTSDTTSCSGFQPDGGNPWFKVTFGLWIQGTQDVVANIVCDGNAGQDDVTINVFGLNIDDSSFNAGALAYTPRGPSGTFGKLWFQDQAHAPSYKFTVASSSVAPGSSSFTAGIVQIVESANVCYNFDTIGNLCVLGSSRAASPPPYLDYSPTRHSTVPYDQTTINPPGSQPVTEFDNGRAPVLPCAMDVNNVRYNATDIQYDAAFTVYLLQISSGSSDGTSPQWVPTSNGNSVIDWHWKMQAVPVIPGDNTANAQWKVTNGDNQADAFRSATGLISWSGVGSTVLAASMLRYQDDPSFAGGSCWCLPSSDGTFDDSCKLADASWFDL